MQLPQIVIGLVLVVGAIVYINLNPLGDPVETVEYDPDNLETLIRPGPNGPRLLSPGLAMPDGRIGEASDAIAAFRPVRASDTPYGTKVVFGAKGCDFPEPGPDALVANVHVGRGVATGIELVSEETLATWATAWIKQHTTAGAAKLDTSEASGQRITIVDVAVTETDRPVYLILQSSQPGVIWNVQEAIGAEVKNIVLIAEGDVGVPTFGREISRHYVDTSDPQGCGVTPARKPGDGWTSEDGTSPLQDTELRNREATYEAYNAWFTGHFGFPSEEGVIGYAEVGHVLVGPLPERGEDKAKRVALEGKGLMMSTSDELLSGGGDARDQRIDEMVTSIVTQAAGGDLTNLRPAAVHRSEQ